MFDSSFRCGVSSFPRSVMAFRHVVSSFRRFDMSFRRFVMAFRGFGTPILPGRFGELSVRFVVSSRLLFRRFFVSLCPFVVSSCRFVVSSCRFVVSTRPLREAIIRSTLHKVSLESMHFYMTYLFIICSVPTENQRKWIF